MKAAFVLFVFLLFTDPLSGQAPSQTRHPGITLFEQAKFKEAVRSLEVASKSKEHKVDAEIWNYLGLAYLARDEVRKSRKAFERSVELKPADPIYRANLAHAYLRNREVEKALKSADKAIELDPGNAGAYHARSIGNLWTSNLDPAEKDAAVFISLDPYSARPARSSMFFFSIGLGTG